MIYGIAFKCEQNQGIVIFSISHIVLILYVQMQGFKFKAL